MVFITSKRRKNVYRPYIYLLRPENLTLERTQRRNIFCFTIHMYEELLHSYLGLFGG